ncbi:hypothetical protein C8R44DRAFT_878608 [Mycena epipterygia]|nr:hypothetical protein C8R44DRAFT_878608 [Mycena epipterygia]
MSQVHLRPSKSIFIDFVPSFQTISVHRRTLEPCLKGFPAAWLTLADEKYVIDRAQCNTEPAPAHQPFMARVSVKWTDFSGTCLLGRKVYGVEIAALILRLYFGVVGCSPQFENDILAFTLTGPCDADGRKEFYIFIYDECLEATKLLHLSPGFFSVADFHLNRMEEE